MLQCVAVCGSMLQCFAVRYSVLQTCVAETNSSPPINRQGFLYCSVLQCVAVCCRVLQCAVVCCRRVLERWFINANQKARLRVLQWIAV